MKQTGQTLKESREKKGITISEVSMATKISSKVLEAMENGDLDELPSKAFLRGFVQTYANYLKLDIKTLMTTFNSELGLPEPKAKGPDEPLGPAPEPTPTPQTTKSSMPRPIDDSSSTAGQKIAIGVGVLVIMLVIKLLFQTIEKYERESKAPTPSEIESTIKRSSDDKVSSTPAVAEKTPEPEKSEPVEVVTPVTKSEVKAEKKPVVPTPPPVATPPSKQAANEAKRALLSETGASIQNKELIIEALDNVEIVFTVDNGSPKHARLDTDKIQIIKASSTIKVDVSDGGAVNIIYNGQDMGVPGTVGKPMQLSYP